MSKIFYRGLKVNGHTPGPRDDGQLVNATGSSAPTTASASGNRAQLLFILQAVSNAEHSLLLTKKMDLKKEK